MRGFLPPILCKEQFGFIKARGFHEAITLAHECAADYDHPSFGGDLMIKVDMEKAYSRMDWYFMVMALHHYGFNDHWNA